MQDVHLQSSTEPGHPHRVRTVAGWLLLALATALTLFVGYLFYDSLTGDYVGDEVATVWVITGFASVLAAVAWVAAIALARSGKNR
jgi:hypothetical protein